jgi:hypothetical protein
MLNESVVEGVVTGKIWNYGGDLFFRLACYRDPGRPNKAHPGGGDRDAPDYVTVRVMDGMVGGVTVSVRPRQRVRVHGWLASRDETLTLQQFVDEVEDDKPAVAKKYLDTSIPTYRLDLVPQRIVVLQDEA